MVGERLLCGFQWDMSGIEVHANTDIGRHTSTLIRTMTAIASDLEGQDKQKHRRSASNLASPKSQSVRFVRKATSTSKMPHKRSQSVHQRPSQADTNYKNALEQELAKQTRKVQHLRYTGATGDSLIMEEAILRSTEQELAKTVQRMFRHPRTGLSLHTFNQIFSPRPPLPAQERSGSMQRKFSSTVRTKLFSLSEATQDNEGGVASPAGGSGQVKGLGHRRFKSDLTGIKVASLSPPPPSPSTSTSTLNKEEKQEEDIKEDEEDIFDSQASEGADSSFSSREAEGFSLPSIDLEFDVTVNVDHGKVVLRTEER